MARAQAMRSDPASARLELDRLDAVRDEVGPARDRGEAELVAAQRRQQAEQVLDVGLVARALPAEHVGVDDDEGSASCGRLLVHAPGLGGDALPRELTRTLEAARDELVAPRDSACSMPAATESGSRGSTSTAAPPATSSVAPPALVTTGVPQAIASSTGMPKPSYSDG